MIDEMQTLILNDNKSWLIKCKLLQAMTCKSLFLFHLERRQLWKLGLVVKLIT